jgi:hypothetical protein
MKFRSKKPSDARPSRRRPVAGQKSTPAAFSYYSQRSQNVIGQQRRSQTVQDAERERRPKKSLKVVLSFFGQRFGLVIVTIAALACLFNLLRLVPNVKVESLNTPVTSYLLHDQVTYKTAADSYLHSSIFNNNKITINGTAVAERLQQDFPELASVNVALPLVGHRPVVYLRTSEPTLILITTTGQSFVIDESGKALTTTARVHNLDALHLPVVHDESGLKLQQGDTVLSSTAATFVSDVIAQLAAKKIDVASLRLPAGTSELDIYPAGVSYFVKFNLQHDSAAQQTGTYLAVSEKLQGQGVMPAQYIDVRVDGRAYYK